MKVNYIYQILKEFYINFYPLEIEEKVQRWIIKDKWTTEKNNAMSAIWNEIEITPNDNTYKALERVKNTIKQIENRKKHLRMRRILLGSAAVIIPVLLFLGSYFYINQDVKMIEVVTSSNQQKQCTLSDGTTILLNSCTKVTYPSKFKNTTRVVTLEGEAYFSVASDATKPFIVKTSNLSVRVLGTKFNISAYPTNDRTIATLNSGKIQVDLQLGKADSRYILKPNQEIIFNKIDKSVLIKTVASENIHWKDGSLIFEDATFNDIVNTIERRYGASIDYNKQDFLYTPYTIKFINNESLEDVLNILQDVVGDFEYKKENKRITIIQKGGNK
nr:FecR domain-containing protein [uncultured Bacteroides sp.]